MRHHHVNKWEVTTAEEVFIVFNFLNLFEMLIYADNMQVKRIGEVSELCP